MTHSEALGILAEARTDQVVLTSMTAVGLWPKFSDTPKDFAYLPSSMGQVVPVGLGLALAQPGLRVIAISGDGSLLMNLGCLVTVATHRVPLTVIVFDNGLYEVTGGQSLANVGQVDYPGLAKSCGWNSVYSFSKTDDWHANVSACLSASGPTFIHLQVQGIRGQQTPKAPRPMQEQIQRLQGVFQV